MSLFFSKPPSLRYIPDEVSTIYGSRQTTIPFWRGLKLDIFSGRAKSAQHLSKRAVSEQHASWSKELISIKVCRDEVRVRKYKYKISKRAVSEKHARSSHAHPLARFGFAGQEKCATKFLGMCRRWYYNEPFQAGTDVSYSLQFNRQNQKWIGWIKPVGLVRGKAVAFRSKGCNIGLCVVTLSRRRTRTDKFGKKFGLRKFELVARLLPYGENKTTTIRWEQDYNQTVRTRPYIYIHYCFCRDITI